jgi:hypothetical protein
MDRIFSLHSDLSWLNTVPAAIDRIFMGKLYKWGVFNEIHCTYKWKWFRRRLIKEEHVGVWGWNSWCGIHCLPVLVGPEIRGILKATIDVGFNHLEQDTGLLPHAIIHRDGQFCSEITHKCYGGIHGEAYNLDNMLCWAKMAMEYFLMTHDRAWFTPKLPVIVTLLDYILRDCRAKFHPVLIEAGIEGDWTECTDWELDNANVTINCMETIRLALECQEVLSGKRSSPSPNFDYSAIFNDISKVFSDPVSQGGFWQPELGFYAHGNDGKGQIVHGDKYFESTVNYFALLWDLIPADHRDRLWQYIDQHKHDIEQPYPVLTNYLPRTGARRKNYGQTVTNGDVWMVLGAHAAAARLQAGYITEGTQMYEKIIRYEHEHGVLHNCIYMNGRVNDSWDPEIANYGSPYVPLILGILGMKLTASGIEFHLRPLLGMHQLEITLFLFEKQYHLSVKWPDPNPDGYRCVQGEITPFEPESTTIAIVSPDFVIKPS